MDPYSSDVGVPSQTPQQTSMDLALNSIKEERLSPIPDLSNPDLNETGTPAETHCQPTSNGNNAWNVPPNTVGEFDPKCGLEETQVTQRSSDSPDTASVKKESTQSDVPDNLSTELSPAQTLGCSKPLQESSLSTSYPLTSSLLMSQLLANNSQPRPTQSNGSVSTTPIENHNFPRVLPRWSPEFGMYYPMRQEYNNMLSFFAGQNISDIYKMPMATKPGHNFDPSCYHLPTTSPSFSNMYGASNSNAGEGIPFTSSPSCYPEASEVSNKTILTSNSLMPPSMLPDSATPMPPSLRAEPTVKALKPRKRKGTKGLNKSKSSPASTVIESCDQSRDDHLVTGSQQLWAETSVANDLSHGEIEGNSTKNQHKTAKLSVPRNLEVDEATKDNNDSNIRKGRRKGKPRRRPQKDKSFLNEEYSDMQHGYPKLIVKEEVISDPEPSSSDPQPHGIHSPTALTHQRSCHEEASESSEQLYPQELDSHQTEVDSDSSPLEPNPTNQDRLSVVVPQLADGVGDMADPVPPGQKTTGVRAQAIVGIPPGKGKCPTCGMIMWLQSLDGHIKVHQTDHEKKFICIICNKLFTRKSHLRNHINIHTGERPHQCNVCNKSFRVADSLREHQRIHTGEKPFHCDECGSDFTRKGHYNMHMRSHTGYRPYKCTFCPQAYTSSTDLTRHMRKHTGERPYQCNLCEKSFAIPSNLIRHLRIHSGVKPYQCDDCDKAFSDPSALISHRRVHDGLRAHACPVCDKHFVRATHVQRHMLTHSQTRDHACDKCDRTFAVAYELQRHMRIHSGDLPFKCPMCSKGFVSRHLLRRHTRVHTGEKPFVCDRCGTGFARNTTLVRHARLHASDWPHQCHLCEEVFNFGKQLKHHLKSHEPGAVKEEGEGDDGGEGDEGGEEEELSEEEEALGNEERDESSGGERQVQESSKETGLLHNEWEDMNMGHEKVKEGKQSEAAISLNLNESSAPLKNKAGSRNEDVNEGVNDYEGDTEVEEDANSDEAEPTSAGSCYGIRESSDLSFDNTVLKGAKDGELESSIRKHEPTAPICDPLEIKQEPLAIFDDL